MWVLLVVLLMVLLVVMFMARHMVMLMVLLEVVLMVLLWRHALWARRLVKVCWPLCVQDGALVQDGEAAMSVFELGQGPDQCL